MAVNLCVSTIIDWRPGQGVPYLLPYISCIYFRRSFEEA